ncbi:MAG TPA: adenosylcobinamide amidohydrolase [Hyphomicrobium sp.]|nr:adenosylcobinamide amidohydrolase [Hyphomicrobium sp.]HRO48814.1 adenosylcobinamide amidohydrolase [Hyphomicrobium sp.]
MLPFTIDCRPPFLVASFREAHEMLSWSLTHPGRRIARQVVWMEVRNADLCVNTDPAALVREKAAAEGLADAVALLTSRNIARYHTAQSVVEDETATCLTTVGLSNGERVGMRIAEPVRLPGTINTLVHANRPLSEAALLETLSIATQARTAAIIAAKVERAGVKVTGTGTDCIVIAAPRGKNRASFAGLHTALGEAVGRAVYKATAAGIETWRTDFEALTSGTTRR